MTAPREQLDMTLVPYYGNMMNLPQWPRVLDRELYLWSQEYYNEGKTIPRLIKTIADETNQDFDAIRKQLYEWARGRRFEAQEDYRTWLLGYNQDPNSPLRTAPLIRTSIIKRGWMEIKKSEGFINYMMKTLFNLTETEKIEVEKWLEENTPMKP